MREDTTGEVLFYQSQFWRLQKLNIQLSKILESFIGHNFGDYKNQCYGKCTGIFVLSVTILETTKTIDSLATCNHWFYRSQFWRLQKLWLRIMPCQPSFIGHNFGDYKNTYRDVGFRFFVLSVTILETTKTGWRCCRSSCWFYRSQFWRLQKPTSITPG